MAIPAGQIHWPFSAQGTPEYIQFGALGALSGHEITHAFDKTGRLYNDKGRLEDWWTNATTAAFEKKSQCIIDQYAQYSVKDPKGEELHINSRFTAGEDVADAGGLAAALAAWMSRMNSDPSGDQYVNSMLPGSHYTRSVLFLKQIQRSLFIIYDSQTERNCFTLHTPAHGRPLCDRKRQLDGSSEPFIPFHGTGPGT